MNPEKVWAVQHPDRAHVESLVETVGCSSIVGSLLVNRGIRSPEEANRFLTPSIDELHPVERLPDIDPAIARLTRAIDHDETITIFADRDLDGIAGATILLRVLRDLEATVGYSVPDKWDGYGLRPEVIDSIERRHTDVLVTIDCGSRAHDPIARAVDCGMDVIVTDHHALDATLPDATACVNPRRDDSAYPHEELSGGAVAARVGEALIDTASNVELNTYFSDALPMAGLATLSDRATLTMENRAIVCEGFDRLIESDFPGLLAACTRWDVTSTRDLSWRLIPRLNAAQEDEKGDLLLRLLLATRASQYEPILDRLEEYYEERKARRRTWEASLESAVSEQADPVADTILFVEIDEYIDGVATGRVSERWGKPVITVRQTGDRYVGSARTEPDIDFIELFETCTDVLLEYWGHPGAAGFRVLDTHLHTFRERLSAALGERYEPADLRPRIEIDLNLSPDQLTTELLAEVETLEPFGDGNPEPHVLFEDIEIADIRLFGDAERHCRLHPRDGSSWSAVYWDGGPKLDSVIVPFRCEIVGTIGRDAVTDEPSITVADLRLHDSS